MFSVYWIEVGDDWRPGMELPGEFKIVEPLATDIGYMVARIIEAGANARMLAAGPCGRWAFTLEAE